MTDYVGVPIPSHPGDILTQVWSFIQARYPNWVPNEAQFEVILAEALADPMAEIRELASDVPTTIFRWLGLNLFGIPALDATYATATVVFTMQDAAGYTVPANTKTAWPALDGTPTGFRLNADLVIAPGSTTGTGTVTALQAGLASSGLTGTGTMIDPFAFVTGVTMTGSSSGGQDAETDAVYLGRLRDLLKLQSPRPIAAPDFSLLAAVQPGVTRALALDNYDATSGLSNQQGVVSVAVVDANGAALSSANKAAVLSVLSTKKVLNQLVYVIDPTPNTIDVGFAATALPGYDTTALNAAIVAALQGYLSAATWGTIPGFGEKPGWVSTTQVRITALARVILNVEGVAFLNSSPTASLHPAALGTTDVAMTGPAPLAVAGTITGTVS